MLFFENFSTKKRIGKKAKTRRGRGGDDGGDGVRGRKKGGEGEEIWGGKREAHGKSGLGKRSFNISVDMDLLCSKLPALLLRHCPFPFQAYVEYP
jgi:hypothetical protein